MRIQILLALTLTAACTTMGPRPADADYSPAEVIADLDWLAGTWSGSMWGGTFTATYSAPVDGKLFSYSQLFTDGEESFYEFEVFSGTGDQVRLQPFPSGKKVTGFDLASYDPASRLLTFTNPTKDFPTQVTYTINPLGQLDITLSDPSTPSDRVERFVLDPARP